jgi:hypothetical protein
MSSQRNEMISYAFFFVLGLEEPTPSALSSTMIHYENLDRGGPGAL